MGFPATYRSGRRVALLNGKETPALCGKHSSPFLACVSCAFAVSPADRSDVDKRLKEASVIFSEIMSAPDRGIPQDLLHRAHCAVIVPGVKKGAFIVGAQYGKGFITCRDNALGRWSAPAAIRTEGGSFGFQIGGSETDVVMLVMNNRGADRLMESQFTLGGEGEVAAPAAYSPGSR
jgi:lipid-binding SYLF domain-containing protein